MENNKNSFKLFTNIKVNEISVDKIKQYFVNNSYNNIDVEVINNLITFLNKNKGLGSAYYTYDSNNDIRLYLNNKLLTFVSETNKDNYNGNIGINFIYNKYNLTRRLDNLSFKSKFKLFPMYYNSYKNNFVRNNFLKINYQYQDYSNLINYNYFLKYNLINTINFGVKLDSITNGKNIKLSIIDQNYIELKNKLNIKNFELFNKLLFNNNLLSFEIGGNINNNITFEAINRTLFSKLLFKYKKNIYKNNNNKEIRKSYSEAKLNKLKNNIYNIKYLNEIGDYNNYYQDTYDLNYNINNPLIKNIFYLGFYNKINITSFTNNNLYLFNNLFINYNSKFNYLNNFGFGYNIRLLKKLNINIEVYNRKVVDYFNIRFCLQKE